MIVLQDKTLIIVPAFKESGNIENTISDLKKYCPGMDVLVIDDGSPDDTFIKAKSQGVLVLRHIFNRGIGTTMQTGYMYAARHGYTSAVQCDGDGQHPAETIPALVAELSRASADMIVGSRYRTEGGFKSSAMRRVGIRFFSGLIKMFTGQSLSDPTSGFRAVNRKVIELFALDYPEDYPEPEVLLTLGRRGYRIVEIPVTMKERVAGKSSINFRRSVFYMLKVSLAMLIDMLRVAKPVQRKA